MFLYYIPKQGSFTVQKPCITGTCTSHKRLPPCKVILSMFNLILKRMLLSVKVPQLCPLVLCFQYHKMHRVSNCYKAILHFRVTHALHCHYKVCRKLLWNCFRQYFKYSRHFLDISCTLSFMHVCYMVNKLNPAHIFFPFTVCYGTKRSVCGPKLLIYIKAFRFLQQ